MPPVKKLLALLLLSLGLWACAPTTLQHVVHQNELVVGTAANMPPLNMTTRDGKVIGYEVDIAAHLASAMGVQLKLVKMPFPDLLPALEAGQLDMVISGMTMTTQRNLKVAFVGPYFISGKSFLTKEATIASARDARRLNQPGTKLAALEKSTSEQFVKEFLPEATLVAVKSYDEGVQKVLDDEVDALIADYPICIVSVFRYPDRGLVSLITPVTYEPLGIALPGDDPLFVNLVENYLGTLKGGGRLKALQERWFKEPKWLGELP